MDPRSEVLIRNIELFAGDLLLAGLPADELLNELPHARGWSWHAGEYALLSQRFTDRTVFFLHSYLRLSTQQVFCIYRNHVS